MSKILWGILLSTLLLAAYDTQGVREVNRIRKSAGMIALKNNAALARAAENHAKYLVRQRRKGHQERPGSSYYTGRTPAERLIRAGYPSRAGVENISYADSGYAHSVGVLTSTLYHRLAFLDFRVDEMGSATYGHGKRRVFVYDLAASPIAKLCRISPRDQGAQAFVYAVCADPQKRIERRSFARALTSVQRRNPRLVLYPPPGATGVPRRFVRETPDPIPGIRRAGYPVTVQLNPAYYASASLKRFRIYDAHGRRLKCKLIQKRNDLHHKLSALDFALIPLSRLRQHHKYTVEFEAQSGGKSLKKRWSFQTGK